MAKQFVVLSMHRSFSSGVARALHHEGVHMGDDMIGEKPSNPKGHFEDLEFLRFNEDVLRLARGDWKSPPGAQALRNAGRRMRSRASGLLEVRDQADHELWGWKDPRTALTWPAYAEPFSALHDPHMICVFRRPDRVAESLGVRNDMRSEIARRITDRYNREILAAAAEFVGLS